MGSSWAATVWEQGLVGIGATLASRLHRTANKYLTNARSEFDHDLALILEPPETADASYGFTGISVVGKGNFPYGEVVDPNVPV